MIELRHDSLVFSFPEVHPSATVSIEFQQTAFFRALQPIPRAPSDMSNSAPSRLTPIAPIATNNPVHGGCKCAYEMLCIHPRFLACADTCSECASG